MPIDPVISKAVNRFYNEIPFPGYDVLKYVVPDDLRTHANAYAALLDRLIPHGASILDAGCGTGQLAALLSLKSRKVWAIDFSENSIALGRALKERLSLENVDYEIRDLLTLEPDGRSFDYIFSNGVLHHTSDAYLGFCNIMKFARSGSYIVIGLYNAYGRFFLSLYRQYINRVYANNAQKREMAIQKMLVKQEEDQAKKDSWYADQYLHPHETVHTVDEVLRWFKLNDIQYVNSLPPAELFRSEKNAKQVFQQSAVSGIRDSSCAHVLKQLKWVVSLRKTGGYYLMIGRKN